MNNNSVKDYEILIGSEKDVYQLPITNFKTVSREEIYKRISQLVYISPSSFCWATFPVVYDKPLQIQKVPAK